MKYVKTVADASKLVGQIIKETLYSAHLLLITLSSSLYVVVGDPDLGVKVFPFSFPCHCREPVVCSFITVQFAVPDYVFS